MPTYEYECTRCGQLTAEFKPMLAPRRQRCPACRGKVNLLISGGLGIVFKGEGFYVNDSRAAGRARAKSDGADGSTSEAKSGSSAGKPAAAPGAATPAAATPESGTSAPKKD